MYLIGMWCGIPEEFLTDDRQTEQRLREVKEAGITLVNLHYGAERNKTMLEFCQRLGLRGSVRDPRFAAVLEQCEGWQELVKQICEDYRDYPALAEYMLMDEPKDPIFDRLGDILEEFRRHDPSHGVYVNLLPLPALETNENYTAHVDHFLTRVRPPILSYDHYPLLKREVKALDRFPEAILSNENRKNNGWDGILFEKFNRDGWFDNLEIISREAKEAGIPWMVIIMLTEHWLYRLLNEAEIRWEAFQALAYGPARIAYFTYWNPGKNGEPWSYHHAMIESDGSRDEHYYQVKRVNRDVHAIEAVIDGAVSLGVRHLGPEEDVLTTPFSPCFGLAGVTGTVLTLGFFEKDGRRFLLAANKDMENTQEVTFTADGGKALRVLDKRTGEFSSADPVLTLEILPGDGDLLEIS